MYVDETISVKRSGCPATPPRERSHRPTYARFLQADPLGYEDGMNLYGYVGGDPVNFTDPSGLAQARCSGVRGVDYDVCGSRPDRHHTDFMNRMKWDDMNPSPADHLAGGPCATAGRGGMRFCVADQAESIDSHLVHASGTSPSANTPQMTPLQSMPVPQRLVHSRRLILAIPTPRVAGQKDKYHALAQQDYVRAHTAFFGLQTMFRGGDGNLYHLTEIGARVDGVLGKFEYVVDGRGNLTHAFFVRGATPVGRPGK